mmetsp:Transcript_40707/g.85520  ORF Transcript_40707/g.85520 Transcript_40707/m.85520 type:complete len:505 (+) Transcript_40707:142-1656(+)
MEEAEAPTISPENGSEAEHNEAAAAATATSGEGHSHFPTVVEHQPPSIPSFIDATSSSPGRTKRQKLKESVIDHTYRDFSQVKVSPEDDRQDDKGKNRPNFPAKLHEIVSNPAYQHIICWLPHGRSWKIVDKYLLTSVVIPHHFSHAKFESFNRSVNGWGFKRLLNPGPDCKSYYHECFLRGRPDLTVMMHRLVNPGKRLPDKSGEPNFYEISKKYPLPASLPPEHKPPPGGAVMPSPGSAAHAQHGAVQFGSPPPHAGNGYMYGYHPHQAPPPHPSMASPTAAAHPGGPGGPGNHPQQPPHNMYWPNQAGSPPYQSHPYGYYPYPPPQMMMMMPQPGPPGYYAMQSYPPPHMQGQYYPTQPGAGAASAMQRGAKPPGYEGGAASENNGSNGGAAYPNQYNIPPQMPGGGGPPQAMDPSMGQHQQRGMKRPAGGPVSSSEDGFHPGNIKAEGGAQPPHPSSEQGAFAALSDAARIANEVADEAAAQGMVGDNAGNKNSENTVAI